MYLHYCMATQSVIEHTVAEHNHVFSHQRVLNNRSAEQAVIGNVAVTVTASTIED